MQTAPVVIIPCSSKAAYLERYAEPDKGWTDEDEARWPVPFWHMDAAMASLLILLTAVDEGLGACFFGIPPEHDGGDPRGASASPTTSTRSARSRSVTAPPTSRPPARRTARKRRAAGRRRAPRLLGSDTTPVHRSAVAGSTRHPAPRLGSESRLRTLRGRADPPTAVQPRDPHPATVQP